MFVLTITCLFSKREIITSVTATIIATNSIVAVLIAPTIIGKAFIDI